MLTAALLSLSISTGLILPVADNPPRFDIASSCRHVGENGMGVGRTADACRDDERKAQTTLRQHWRSYPVASRGTCVEGARLGGPPSYVQVLTCLEMAARK